MNIEINPNTAIFIYRKVFMVLMMLLTLYRLHKKHSIIKTTFWFTFMYFLIISHTSFTKISYDIFDKLIVFFISPAYFLFLSILFFRQENIKGEDGKKESIKYYATLALFVLTEILYIFRNLIFTRQV